MKQVLISAVVAAIVSLATWQIVESRMNEEKTQAANAAETPQPLVLDYTMELVEDSWINGARGAGADHRALAAAANSICYLTKIEIKGITGPEDSSSCSIDIDDFTGSWQVTAAVEEGSQAEIRCNARCLVWE